MVVTSRNRRSNIEVVVIDVEQAMADLAKDLKEAGNWPDDVVRIEPRSQDWAYIETPKGIFLLDNEACGPGGDEKPITAERSGQWPLYFHKEKSMSMFPDTAAILSVQEIHALPTKGTMNFGKWVRKFGHRIEVNFHNWNHFLEETMGVSPADVVH